MRTKKKDYNEYTILEDGIWVRNFTLKESPPVDQNTHLLPARDLALFLKNETHNYKQKFPQIGAEQIAFENVLVVSDGHNFTQKRMTLMTLPRTIQILGTNDVLNQWIVDRRGRPMTYYVVNNPYQECTKFLPRNKYFPPCIASSRTNRKFIEQYNSGVFLYRTPPSRYYSGLEYGTTYYYIDDYRNPICAAISLAYRFGARRLLLFCHDECFEEERPGSVRGENGLWTYPQQQISNRVIDAHLQWLKGTGVLVGYHADGLKLNNATYIPLDEVQSFFTREIQ